MSVPLEHRGSQQRPIHIPPWVQTIGVPIWVTDDDGFIQFMNNRAEVLFGHTLEEWYGCACQLVIAAHHGECSLCGRHCLIRDFGTTKHEVEPMRMLLGNDDQVDEASVLVITVEDVDGRQLIHCVVEDERERRMQRFIRGVMHRSPDIPDDTATRCGELTPREREVLSLLSADATLHDVALQLSVSYATVRNHVQHILPKLGVHSILEAVAVWVMEEGGTPD